MCSKICLPGGGLLTTGARALASFPRASGITFGGIDAGRQQADSFMALQSGLPIGPRKMLRTAYPTSLPSPRLRPSRCLMIPKALGTLDEGPLDRRPDSSHHL